MGLLKVDWGEAIFPKDVFVGKPKRMMSLQITFHEIVKYYCVESVIVHSPIGEKARNKIELEDKA